jgi:hypothetical protein
VQQHAIDVGDVPGHQVRVYEVHSTYPSDAPVYNGVKVKESWNRSLSDYTDGSGRFLWLRSSRPRKWRQNLLSNRTHYANFGRRGRIENNEVL